MMDLHIGHNELLPEKRIIGIFDMDTTTVSARTRKFLRLAESEGAVIDLGGELPKSFILTDWPSETTVYTSPVSSVTLGARARRGIRRKRR